MENNSQVNSTEHLWQNKGLMKTKAASYSVDSTLSPLARTVRPLYFLTSEYEKFRLIRGELCLFWTQGRFSFF